MKMTGRAMVCFAWLSLSVLPSPAHAQWAVFDGASFGQLVNQAQTGLNQLQQLQNTYQVTRNQLQQLQSFYTSFSHMTNAAQVVPTLLQGAQMYPLQDLAAVEGILRSNGSGFTGSLANSAQAVLQQTQYFRSMQNDFSAKEMNSTAENTAGQIAAAQVLYKSAQNRVSGMEEMKDQLSQSADPKQTMDLNTRAQIENGVTQAQANQTAALQVLQHAQDKVSEERQEQNWRQTSESLEDAERQASGE